ncbi:hypothetical protein Bca4012_076578 [Brassica carinata]
MELLTSSSWEFLLSRKERYKNFSCDISDDVRKQRLKSEMAEKASGGGVGEAKQEEEEEKKEPGRRRRWNCDGRETAA